MVRTQRDAIDRQGGAGCSLGGSRPPLGGRCEGRTGMPLRGASREASSTEIACRRALCRAGRPTAPPSPPRGAPAPAAQRRSPSAPCRRRTPSPGASQPHVLLRPAHIEHSPRLQRAARASPRERLFTPCQATGTCTWSRTCSRRADGTSLSPRLRGRPSAPSAGTRPARARPTWPRAPETPRSRSESRRADPREPLGRPFLTLRRGPEPASLDCTSCADSLRDGAGAEPT